MTRPVAVSLRACAKTWPGGVRALGPIELDVAGGQTLALLGPSGCGKTTLLRLIAGLETPDPGAAIRFDGVDVTALPAEKRGVGVVFQHYALFPNLTVLDNVAYGLRVRGVPRAERHERARAMLDTVQLGGFAGRHVDQLSGGQRQRVALARALAIEPRVLLLDEPLTALDAKLRDTLRAELALMLRRLGITTLIVTHDQEEAMMLGERVAVMSAGRIEQVGPAETLYREPASDFVAGFLGTSCEVRGALDGSRLAAGDGLLRFRPHEVRLAPADGGRCARVRARFFLGAALRLELVLDDGQCLTAVAPADAPFAEGERVAVHLTRVSRPDSPPCPEPRSTPMPGNAP